MTKALKYTTAVFYLFLILLLVRATLGSYLGDIAGNAIYLVGAAAILLFGLSLSAALKREREEASGVIEHRRDVLTMDGGAVGTMLPLIAPTVGVVFLFSYLTSLLLWAAGLEGSEVELLPLFDMLVLHAVIPALVEEMIFRFLPMLLLAPYSHRWCIVASSVGFALIHLDLFQIPYALVAGVLFMGVNLLAGSVWPSVIIHFINNSLSVIWIMYCSDGTSAAIFVSVLAALSVIGLAVVLVHRRHYLGLCRGLLQGGEPCRNMLPFASIIALTLFITVTNMLL